MKDYRIHILVETNGDIPNYEGHVAAPLRLIVAQAFTYMIQPVKRIKPEHVMIDHDRQVSLEEGTLVAITIRTDYSEENIPVPASLQARITDSIRDSGMFRCRTTHGAVRLEIQLNASLPIPEAA